MEETAPLVLPYAFDIDEKGWERGLAREAEEALFFLLIERERKRMLLNGARAYDSTRVFKKPEGAAKIALVSKVYYSAWVAPWKEGRGLISDGLGLFPQVVYYDELPDYKTFMDGIKESASAEEYLDVLRRHSLTFLNFQGSRSFIISLIPQKDSVSDLQNYIIHYRRETVTNALSLNPRISWQQVSSFIEMLRESEADIERLNTVRKDLTNRTNQLVEQQKETIESVQKEYLPRIEEEKAEARIEELQAECQSKVIEVEKRMEEEIKSLSDGQAEAQSEIQGLQEKRDEYSKTLKSIKQQIEALSKQLDVPQYRRNELSLELSNQRARLEALKMEHLKLEDLAEARKGVTEELSTIRESLAQISVEMNKVTESMLEMERELRQEDEKREILQESTAKLRRQMADVKKAMKDLDILIVEKQDRLAGIPHQIKDVKKRRHEDILRIDRDYRLKFDEIRGRIGTLRIEMTRRIETDRRRIGEIMWRTDEIVSQIDRLIEAKSSFIHSFHDAAIYLPRNLEINAPTLLQIPLYLVCYETPTGRGYTFYSPITVKRIRKILWSKKISIEIRMKNFDRVVKGKLHETIKQDTSFEEEVLNSCARLNLLENHEMSEVLLRGLTQLKLRKLVSATEANKAMAILSGYTHSLKGEQKEYE